MNIQLFAEPDDKQGGIPSVTTEPVVTPPVETEDDRKKRQALEYSERLNKDKQKIRDESAQAAGFKDWEDMQANGLEKKLLEQGIQPDTGVPIVRNLANDLVSRDPRIIEAEKIIAERKAEQERSAVAGINAKFGTQYTSVEDLDADTKALIEKGVNPERAYIANHYDKLPTNGTPTGPTGKQILEASKAHLTSLPGTASGTSDKEISLKPEQYESIRKIAGLNMTDEQIRDFLKKNPGIKIPK